MSDDDYIDEDATELAIPREEFAREEATQPTQPVPADVSERFEATQPSGHVSEKTDTLERPKLKRPSLSEEHDATLERPALKRPSQYEEDKTVLRPSESPSSGAEAATNVVAAKDVSRTPRSDGRGAQQRSPVSGLQPKPNSSGRHRKPSASGLQPKPRTSSRSGDRLAIGPVVEEDDETLAVDDVASILGEVPRPPPSSRSADKVTVPTPKVTKPSSRSADQMTVPTPKVGKPKPRTTNEPTVPGAKIAPSSRSADETTAPGVEVAPVPSQAPISRPNLPEAPKLQPRRNDTSEQLKRLGLTRKKKPNANHVRPNSGFYSLPEANVGEGTADVTVVGTNIHYEDERRDAIGLLVGLGLGLVTSLGLVALAISRWSSPGAMMVLTLLGMVLCGGVTGGIVLPGDGERLEGLKRSLMPMGICAALILIAGLSWQLAVVRDTLRPFASTAPQTAALVLADDAQRVALSECIRLSAKLDSRANREALVEGLTGRRALTAECIGALDSEGAAELTAVLADAWHSELVGGEADAERACELADSLILLDRPVGDLETRLLACVLSGPTSNVQSCCGVALVKRVETASDSWVSAVGSSDRFVADEPTAVGLMTLAFHQQGVNQSQREFVDAADFDGAAGRRLALNVACDALQAGAEGLSRHFAASLEGCQIDEATVPRSREVWADVCTLAADQVRNAVEPKKALCKATRLALVEHAVIDASRIVRQAAKDRSANRNLAIAIDVEANTTRGNLKSSMKSLEQWGKDFAADSREHTEGPTFRPEW